MTGAKRSLIRLIGLMLLFAAAPARGADAPGDTVVVPGPAIEITALRGRDRLQDIPAVTFAFPRERIRESGVVRLSSLLSTLPGLYGYLQNSSGDPSVVDPRGFTANGERSYLKMLVNGQDVRDVENGGVDWDWLFPDDVERLEVVQGFGAWAYGDGSEGGIVNIVRTVPEQPFQLQLGGRVGSFGLRTGTGSIGGKRGDLAGSLRYSARYVDGWRDRSRETVYASGGEASWNPSDRTRFSLDVAWLDADREDPGTLTPDLIEQERTRAETRTDFNQAKRLTIGAHARTLREEGEWTLSPYFRAENVVQLRTLFTQTPIEQAKWHPSRSWTEGVEAGWGRSLTLVSRPVGVRAGAQFEHSKLRSTYFDYDPGTIGGLRSRTESRRVTQAGWANARVEIDPFTTGRLGLRVDGHRLESEELVTGDRNLMRRLWSVSPFVALSRRFMEHANAYASYSSAFRVPSLNQLYDRRPIDVFGNTSILSNPDLSPQRAQGVELGGRWDGTRMVGMLAFYSLWVRDEIDFDATTFSYANIDRSWHRGIEAAVEYPVGWDVTARANGTWSPTTIDGGANDGNQINAVPAGTAYAGAGWVPAPGWTVEAGARWVGRQYLDKANQHPLGEFTTLEITASAKLERIRASLRVGNLLQRDYADTGYLLDLQPFFGVQERFSPAAPRSVTIAVSLNR